jgi:hypothetical protein
MSDVDCGGVVIVLPMVVRCGAVRCGAVRCGAVRCGAVLVNGKMQCSAYEQSQVLSSRLVFSRRDLSPSWSERTFPLLCYVYFVMRTDLTRIHINILRFGT